MNLSANISDLELTWEFIAKKSILAAVLGVEMILGIAGNTLILFTKIKGRGQFKSQYWVSVVSLSLSDLGCSLFVISSSLLAVLINGQRSPWCEVVCLLKFAFITSSLGSLAVLCMQQALDLACRGRHLSIAVGAGCLISWLTGMLFGTVPVAFKWIRYDPAEMLCAVFWENNYSAMLAYILCAFCICIFPPFLLVVLGSVLTSAGWIRNGSRDPDDLSSVTPLLVSFYLLCYTPFAVSELVLLGRLDQSPAPDWLRTLSSVTAYLDCGINPFIYCTNQDFRVAMMGLLWTNRKAPSEPVLTAVAKLDL
ncbi:protein trapped in endoderm-1 [Paramormyrops kingsleyae]|uniref:protein trapped in endoderm-1 n=1 Tax=Paramormyrops kingsleyae TaxID=1676925 RepID=UPI003B976FB9